MRKILASTLGGAALLVATNASASFHFMQIVEVYAGPNSYVQLQMYAAGQNFTAGHSIRVYNAAGVETANIPLANVTVGADQSTILIGTATMGDEFDITPDFATLPALDQAGGKVCFDPDPGVDCFAWGNYSGSTAATGTPFAALGTSAAKRKITAGTADKLDAADDTDDSAADFVAGTPEPKNNGGVPAGNPDGGSGNPDGGGSSSGNTPPGTTPGGSTPTNPLSPTPSSSSAPAAEDDGCNATGRAGDFVTAPLLALGALALVRRKRKK